MPELKLTDMNQRIGIDKVQFYGFGLELLKLIKKCRKNNPRHGTIC